MIVKNKRILVFIVIGITVLATAGLLIMKFKGDRGTRVPPVKKVPVETAQVKMGSISAGISYTGTVVSNNDSVISAKIMGIITSLPVKEGDRVKKGDILAVIDDSEYTGKINTLRQRVNTAELNYRFLDQQLSKYQQLFQAQAISEQNYLQYKLQRDTAASQLEEAKFALREVEVALENAYIKAPFDGIVNSLQSQLGDMASPGKPILTLSDTSRLKVQVRVTETDLEMIKENMEVVLASPLLPKNLKSKVAKIFPSAEPQARSTIVEVPVPEVVLKPGTSVDVSFLTGNKEKTLVVPTGAVEVTKAGSYVYLVKDGRAVKKPVTIGIKSDNMIEILEGVNEDEEIITSNLSKVTDGKVVYVFKREGGAK